MGVHGSWWQTDPGRGAGQCKGWGLLFEEEEKAQEASEGSPSFSLALVLPTSSRPGPLWLGWVLACWEMVPPTEGPLVGRPCLGRLGVPRWSLRASSLDWVPVPGIPHLWGATRIPCAAQLEEAGILEPSLLAALETLSALSSKQSRIRPSSPPREFPRGRPSKLPQTGRLRTYVVSHGSGSQKSEIKVWQGRAPSGGLRAGSFLPLPASGGPFPVTASPHPCLCLHVGPCLSSCDKTSSPWT